MRLARAARPLALALAAVLAACAGPRAQLAGPEDAVDPADPGGRGEPPGPGATAGGDAEALDGAELDAGAPPRDPAASGDGGAPSREPAAAPRSHRHPGPLPEEDAASAALRARLVSLARARLDRPAPRLDCSGFVLAVYRAAGLGVALGPAPSRSESLWRAGRRVELPRPGDLAFFHDTYDRNRDRRLNDRFTHVALVEAVDGDAVTLLHRGGRGVERLRMDLARPSDPAANDPVRVRRRGDAPGTRYLAGELFAAFGALLDGEVTQMLQARRAAVSGARHPAVR